MSRKPSPYLVGIAAKEGFVLREPHPFQIDTLQLIREVGGSASLKKLAEHTGVSGTAKGRLADRIRRAVRAGYVIVVMHNGDYRLSAAGHMLLDFHDE